MGEKNIKASGSNFLKNLQDAVNSGDPSKGKEAIEKINEIHKLADSMDGEIAGAKFDKRIEEAGKKDALSSEERKKISLESEKEKVKREKEEARLALIADIENVKHEIYEVKNEFEAVSNQYKGVIEAQEEELKVLEIKYEARYGEDDDE